MRVEGTTDKMMDFLKKKGINLSELSRICLLYTSGGVLGVAGLYTMPDFPAGDMIDAVAVGMASGLAATGANQLYKQQCK